MVYTGLHVIDGLTYYFNPETGYKVKNSYVSLDEGKYYFDSQGRRTESPIYVGIDVSHWQERIDWNKVKNDKLSIDYAIIKVAGRGTKTGELYYDDYYKKNIEGAYNAGLKIGVYFYTCADNPQEAIEEANYLIELLKPYKNKITFPVAFDIEDPNHYPSNKNDSNYKNKQEVSRIIMAFIKYYKKCRVQGLCICFKKLFL